MVHIPDDVAKREAARLRGQDVLTLADSRLADILDPPSRPHVGERIRITAEGVVTAYDPGSDAVQLDHEECWWSYNGDGICYEVVGGSAPLDPQSQTLRERCRVLYIMSADHIDAVLAVVADWLASQPLWTVSYAAGYAQQRDHDVRLLRGES